MPATVRLSYPLGGDQRIPPRNRFPEPRNPQKSHTEAIRTQPNPTKNQNRTLFCTRIDGINWISENLVHRLQILKDNLAILKSKSNRVLAEIYKKPPDPDPTVSITSRNAIVKRNHEEQVEIPATMLHEKMELQVFTYSNLENEEASYRTQE